MRLKTGELTACLSDSKLVGEAGEKSYRRISIDSRQTKPGDLFLALKGEKHDGHDYLYEARRNGATGFVVSCAVDLKNNGIQVFEVQDTLRALHELAAKVRQEVKGLVVGVTGSNGKTTTKEMAANILSRKYRVHRNHGNYNNLIGLPLSIFDVKNNAEWMVLEMGSNNPGEISKLSCIASPEWGIITNIAEVHLEGFGNLLGVMKEKASILDGLQPNNPVIINGDDPSLKSYIKNLGIESFTFGLRSSNDVYPEDYSIHGDGRVSFRLENGPVIDLNIIGFHSLQNALAASALALQVGLSHEMIKEGLEMPLYQIQRMEVTEQFDVTFINDSYNANPRSMFLAAESLSLMEGEGRKILVLGDMYELGEGSARLHKELGKRLSMLDIDVVVTVGGLGAVVGRAMKDEDLRRGRKREIKKMMDFSKAGTFLLKSLKAGDIILFKASRGVKMENMVEMVMSGLEKGGSPG